MVEPLIVFGNFAWVIFLIIWEKKPTATKTFAMGIVSAILVLIKGVTILIPVFFSLYIILTSDRLREGLKSNMIFILAFVLFILPWSIYATQ